SRITHEQLLAIGRDGIHSHNEHWLRKFTSAKKSALVDDLHKSFAIPKGGNVRDDILQWLPTGMAFGLPAPKEPAKGKKGRKAAIEAIAVRECRVCGCTEDDCSDCIERTGEPCHWVEDDLCS